MERTSTIQASEPTRAGVQRTSMSSNASARASTATAAAAYWTTWLERTSTSAQNRFW